MGGKKAEQNPDLASTYFCCIKILPIQEGFTEANAETGRITAHHKRKRKGLLSSFSATLPFKPIFPLLLL